MMAQAPTVQISYAGPTLYTHQIQSLTYFSVFVHKCYIYSQNLSWDLMISNHQEITLNLISTRSKLVISELLIYSIFYIFNIKQSVQDYTYSQHFNWDQMISNHQDMILKPVSTRSKLVISELFIYSIMYNIFFISNSPLQPMLELSGKMY